MTPDPWSPMLSGDRVSRNVPLSEKPQIQPQRPEQQLGRRASMTVQTFTKKEWHAFFDRIAKGLVGKRAEIEVAALPLGRRIAAEWLPLLGITYEPKEDLL